MVAFDRSIKSAESFGLDGPVDKWRRIRQEIHDEVCAKGYNETLGSFTQYYGTTEVDASLLQIPLLGFLPCSDPRVAGTINTVERELYEEFLRWQARRNRTPSPPSEGPGAASR